MKAIICILIILIQTLTTTTLAQDILTTYYNGDKDKMSKEAFELIQIPNPTFQADKNSPQPTPQTISDMGFEQAYQATPRHFTLRDDTEISSYHFPATSHHTILLLHGVASSAYMYNQTAGMLRESTNAQVYAIDMRGHGQSEGRTGDVDYINQYVDDLSDIIAIIRHEKPNGKIILAGHSMGGGLALRYAMEKQYTQPDGFLMFAPHIGHNSPAYAQTQSTENTHEEPFMKIHIERIIGLTMLNELGNHDHDSLPVLFFNLPDSVPLRSYSHRANISTAPADYATGLQALDRPTLVLVGSEDEAFSSEGLKNAVLEFSTAEIQIIEGATHNGVRHHTQSFDYIKDWFTRL